SRRYRALDREARPARVHAPRAAHRALARGHAPGDRVRRPARRVRLLAPWRGPSRSPAARARRRPGAGPDDRRRVPIPRRPRPRTGVVGALLRHRDPARVRHPVGALPLAGADRVHGRRHRPRRGRRTPRPRRPAAAAAEPEPVRGRGPRLPRRERHLAHLPVPGPERLVARPVGRGTGAAARRPRHGGHDARRPDTDAPAPHGLAARRGAHGPMTDARVGEDAQGLLTFYTAARLPLPHLPREKVDFPGGQFTYRITDEEGRINVNSSPPDRIDRLLQVLGLDRSVRDIIGDSLQDWRDTNDEHRLNGAESDY